MKMKSKKYTRERVKELEKRIDLALTAKERNLSNLFALIAALEGLYIFFHKG